MMLDGGSELWIPYESHFITRLHRKLRDGADFSSPSFRRELVRTILEDEYRKGWDVDVSMEEIDLDACRDLGSTVDTIYSAHMVKAGKTRWGDKSPSYVMQADVLNELFPESQFVHIVRDGRDVARSVVRMFWGPDDYISALREWTRKVELVERMLRMLPPERHMTMRYEDLVAEPEGMLRAVCGFLGMDYEDSMLGYTDRAVSKVGGRVNAHHAHLLEKPRKDLAQRWRREMGGIDQAIAHEVAGPMLNAYGYETGRRNHPLKLFGVLRHKYAENRSWRRAGRP
jgi:hypothetical protein